MYLFKLMFFNIRFVNKRVHTYFNTFQMFLPSMKLLRMNYVWYIFSKICFATAFIHDFPYTRTVSLVLTQEYKKSLLIPHRFIELCSFAHVVEKRYVV